MLPPGYPIDTVLASPRAVPLLRRLPSLPTPFCTPHRVPVDIYFIQNETLSSVTQLRHAAPFRAIFALMAIRSTQQSASWRGVGSVERGAGYAMRQCSDRCCMRVGISRDQRQRECVRGRGRGAAEK